MSMSVSRRDFLFGGAAFGGLVATSALPTFAADDPSLFPGRGRFERLSLGYGHIVAGAEKPFTLLHISDTHLTAAHPHESEKLRAFMQLRAKTFGGRQEEALRDSLSWAREHVDYVLHIDVRDRFSPTAMEYVVGGNFMFHGEELTILP